MAPKQVKVKKEITETEEESNEVADSMAVSSTPDVGAQYAKDEPIGEDMPELEDSSVSRPSEGSDVPPEEEKDDPLIQS